MAEEIKYEEYNDRFDEFIEEVRNNGSYNAEKIEHAYQLARKAHQNQRRRSGEPYIMHPVAVAKILFDMGMDNECIIAALLHDVVEDTKYDLDFIKNEFGEDVALLVDGVTKLGRTDFIICALLSICRSINSAKNLLKRLKSTLLLRTALVSVRLKRSLRTWQSAILIRLRIRKLKIRFL